MLIVDCDINKLNAEFMYYLNSAPSLNIISNRNYIIKYFQQNQFYYTENILFNDKDIAYKIINNRSIYLHKHPNNITDLELLDGFKKSGIYYGYSHFNPNLFKWFINKYNIRQCYDPCGGWGHRLLGSLSLDKYIYNDLSINVVDNIQSIIDFFKINNTVIYNNDARTFVPTEEFDSIFTCPPYYNLEHYECGDFVDIEDYNSLLTNIYNTFYYSKKCKILGIVLREDFCINNNYIVKYDVKSHKSEHLLKNKNKHYKEYLYIYTK